MKLKLDVALFERNSNETDAKMEFFKARYTLRSTLSDGQSLYPHVTEKTRETEDRQGQP